MASSEGLGVVFFAVGDGGVGALAALGAATFFVVVTAVVRFAAAFLTGVALFFAVFVAVFAAVFFAAGAFFGGATGMSAGADACDFLVVFLAAMVMGVVGMEARDVPLAN
ncbi:MAG: hypothetical protein RLZZ245_1101 [Verrucomicrobiota bacterium]|jgi:hypothetical protein